MSGPRQFYGGRTIPSRPTYDRINPKFVPPSRHAIFIRGFPSDVDNHKIREFFQDAAKSSCGIDFTSYNEEQRKLSIALRFESHDIAKDVLNRFNNTEIFGNRVDITWFKDLKKARDRMMDDKRVPYDDHRMNYKPNWYEYERRDNREYPDNRRRFQSNNNNNSYNNSNNYYNRGASLENGEAISDKSYDHNDRSRSKSSFQSVRSESGSLGEHDRRSLSLINNKDKLSLIGSSDKPSAYRVDLDETIESSLHSTKSFAKTERLLTQHTDNTNNNMVEEGSYLDEKKKKKKKRKRRHMDLSGSQDSLAEPLKMAKYENEPVVKNEGNQFAAIAGDLNNWKQTASDSEDYLPRINQISKSRPQSSLTKSDKFNNDKNMKLLKLKIENVEKAYKKDSETYSSVINILIRTQLIIYAILSCHYLYIVHFVINIFAKKRESNLLLLLLL